VENEDGGEGNAEEQCSSEMLKNHQGSWFPWGVYAARDLAISHFEMKSRYGCTGTFSTFPIPF
jgi:hypothetical protein